MPLTGSSTRVSVSSAGPDHQLAVRGLTDHDAADRNTTADRDCSKHHSSPRNSGVRLATVRPKRSDFFLVGKETDRSEPVAQDRDQRQVRGRHRIVAQAGGWHPGQNLPFACHRNAVPAAAGEEAASAGGNLHSCGWRRSAGQGSFSRVPMPSSSCSSRIRQASGVSPSHLAAGKLPQPEQGCARAAAPKHTAIGVDQGDG